MNHVALLHLVSFFIYLYLFGFILYKNPRALLNRVCALLILCFAIWSFGAGFLRDISTSGDMAKLSVNIGSIGWCGFASFFLWFTLIFTKKEKILKKKIIYLLLFLPAAFFIYKQWTGFLVVDFIRQPYGWTYTWSKSIWTNLFYAYYSSFMVLGIYLCLDFRRKTSLLREKKQAGIIFITILISLILGSISDVLLPELNIHHLPPMADVISLIWAGGLVYAITRYGLMTITPQVAADNILATMGDSLILIEPDGKITTVNQATLDLLEYKKRELIGRPITTILAEGEYTEKFNELMQKGKLRDYYAVYRSSSGQEIPVSLFMSLLKDKQGELVGIVCIAKDMREIRRLTQKEKELAVAAEAAVAEAEKKRAAELEKAYKELGDTVKELRETQAQLIQSAKMGAVGQLGAGIAHELNNPLGGVSGYAQLVLQKFKKPNFSIDDFKSCQEYIESIERESTRCVGIVQNLLKLSRQPIYTNPEPVDIAKAIEEILSILGQQLKLKNIKVITDIEPDLAKVMGIVNQLQQVFINFILNTQQAMPGGGRLKITAENILNTKTSSPQVKIEFADTGCGIPQEDLQRIFEPFFTTRQKEKGTGLGLSVSYQIIQHHKGTISVNSQVGKGTTFTVILPVLKKKGIA